MAKETNIVNYLMKKKLYFMRCSVGLSLKEVIKLDFFHSYEEI